MDEITEQVATQTDSYCRKLKNQPEWTSLKNIALIVRQDTKEKTVGQIDVPGKSRPRKRNR